MNKHIILLINGKRRSGKGLLSNKIVEKTSKKYSNNVHILSFAEPIKQITQPILEEIKWDGQNKEVVRPLWIAMGEVGRNIDNNLWCSKVFDKIENIIIDSANKDQDSLFIIDDLRFPNELDYFKSRQKILADKVKKIHNGDVKVTSVRIEKFLDPEKFIKGVDDNSTETSFDKLVNICFDYIVPADILIDREWYPNFQNVDVIAQTVIKNLLK
ncbi:hypothetical protein ACJA23_02610 [Mycoplasma corogypsi]|uniref:hypothetical protein n=1 Tax=Mycoplasma corogypsi TaxID=2106 RepID=UPI0038739209